MKIKVQYYGQIRQLAGVEKEDIQLGDRSTVEDALKQIAEKHGENFKEFICTPDNKLRGSVVAVVNDDIIGDSSAHTLGDKDNLSLFTPIAGG